MVGADRPLSGKDASELALADADAGCVTGPDAGGRERSVALEHPVAINAMHSKTGTNRPSQQGPSKFETLPPAAALTCPSRVVALIKRAPSKLLLL